jgi:hypothetical protein
MSGPGLVSSCVLALDAQTYELMLGRRRLGEIFIALIVSSA